jgi:hypothetical protein
MLKIFSLFFLTADRDSFKGPSQAQNMEGKLNLEEDPILKFIGGVSHGSLAREIDKTLYGK